LLPQIGVHVDHASSDESGDVGGCMVVRDDRGGKIAVQLELSPDGRLNHDGSASYLFGRQRHKAGLMLLGLLRWRFLRGTIASRDQQHAGQQGWPRLRNEECGEHGKCGMWNVKCGITGSTDAIHHGISSVIALNSPRLFTDFQFHIPHRLFLNLPSTS
jgi:hypothetical protein